MGLLKALHAIRHKVDGKSVEQKPGDIFSASDADAAFFKRLGAAVEPTEQELILYRFANDGDLQPELPAGEGGTRAAGRGNATKTTGSAAKAADSDPIG